MDQKFCCNTVGLLDQKFCFNKQNARSPIWQIKYPSTIMLIGLHVVFIHPVNHIRIHLAGTIMRAVLWPEYSDYFLDGLDDF
jgi:hypothetical protein